MATVGDRRPEVSQNLSDVRFPGRGQRAVSLDTHYKKDVFWMGLGSAWCVAAEESERGPPRGVARRASERAIKIPKRKQKTNAYKNKIIVAAKAKIISRRADRLAIHSPREPGRPWPPIFLKSNMYKYIGTFSLLFVFTC